MRCNIKKSLRLCLVLLLTITNSAYGQKTYQSATIGFMNAENLFDTIRSAGYIDGNLDYQDQFYHVSVAVDDIPKYDTVDCKCRLTSENIKGKKIIRDLILIDEFTPDGPKAFTSERYHQKLNNLSRLVFEMGKDITGNLPVIVGIVEVETRQVVEDLVNTPKLKPYNYGVVHYNSLDKRGIDNALIYQKDRFKVLKTKKHEVIAYNENGNRDYTRDILQVSGLLDGEMIHVFVNHWPSRRGGEAASAPKRAEAAKVLKKAIEEIKAVEPDAKILSMGDFNDDPVSASIKEVLGTEGKEKKLKAGELFNPMEKMYKKGFGTLAYRDSWNLFDQIIVTSPLVGDEYKTYQIYRTEIFSPDYLVSKEGTYKGYPHRMYSFDTFRADGYSDHFPVYTVLLREVPKP